jgi:hypothetical protein
LLKQPIAEYFRVFNHPVKIPLWTLLQSQNSTEFPSSLCLSAHCLNALLAEYKESSMILASNEPTTEFFLYALLALAQCPLGRAFTELFRASVCNCVPPTQPFLLRGIQQPQRSSSELLISVSVPP